MCEQCIKPVLTFEQARERARRMCKADGRLRYLTQDNIQGWKIGLRKPYNGICVCGASGARYVVNGHFADWILE